MKWKSTSVIKNVRFLWINRRRFPPFFLLQYSFNQALTGDGSVFIRATHQPTGGTSRLLSCASLLILRRLRVAVFECARIEGGGEE